MGNSNRLDLSIELNIYWLINIDCRREVDKMEDIGIWKY